jgi:hypothetical protein
VMAAISVDAAVWDAISSAVFEMLEGGAVLDLHGGLFPAGTRADPGVTLASIVLGAPVLVNGVLTWAASDSGQVLAVAAGDIVFGRMRVGSIPLFDIPAAVSGAPIELDRVRVYPGGRVLWGGLTLSFGGA